jgi:hypothetical protein
MLSDSGMPGFAAQILATGDCQSFLSLKVLLPYQMSSATNSLMIAFG